MRVLLIEDDDQLQRAMVRLLNRWFVGVQIETVSTATRAIEYLLAVKSTRKLSREEGIECHDGAYDLIISDYDLDGRQTGGDVLAWIKAHMPEFTQKFVFFSGNPAAGEIHDRVLMKPCPVADLQEWILAAVNSPNPSA